VSEKFEIVDIDNKQISTGSFDECIDYLVEKYNDNLEFTTMCVLVETLDGQVVAMVKHTNADIKYT
jgi:hypothetical protein